MELMEKIEKICPELRKLGFYTVVIKKAKGY